MFKYEIDHVLTKVGYPAYIIMLTNDLHTSHLNDAYEHSVNIIDGT